MIEVAIVIVVSLIVLTGLATKLREDFIDYEVYSIKNPKEILENKKFNPKPIWSQFSYN